MRYFVPHDKNEVIAVPDNQGFKRAGEYFNSRFEADNYVEERLLEKFYAYTPEPGSGKTGLIEHFAETAVEMFIRKEGLK